MINAVGVVIPAHDEQDLLPSCLAAVRLAARQVSVPVHVVVVGRRTRAPTEPRNWPVPKARSSWRPAPAASAPPGGPG